MAAHARVLRDTRSTVIRRSRTCTRALGDGREIGVPSRRLRCAAVGGDDDEPLTGVKWTERARCVDIRAAPDGRHQQHGCPLAGLECDRRPCDTDAVASAVSLPAGATTATSMSRLLDQAVVERIADQL